MDGLATILIVCNEFVLHSKIPNNLLILRGTGTHKHIQCQRTSVVEFAKCKVATRLFSKYCVVLPGHACMVVGWFLESHDVIF